MLNTIISFSKMLCVKNKYQYLEDPLRLAYKKNTIKGVLKYFGRAYMLLELEGGLKAVTKIIGKLPERPWAYPYHYLNQGVAELTAFHVDRLIGKRMRCRLVRTNLPLPG